MCQRVNNTKPLHFFFPSRVCSGHTLKSGPFSLNMSVLSNGSKTKTFTTNKNRADAVLFFVSNYPEYKSLLTNFLLFVYNIPHFIQLNILDNFIQKISLKCVACQTFYLYSPPKIFDFRTSFYLKSETAST